MASMHCLNFFFPFSCHYLPVASLAHELSKLFEIVLVRLIKAVGYRTIDVDDCHNLGRNNRISFKGTFIACRAI